MHGKIKVVQSNVNSHICLQHNEKQKEIGNNKNVDRSCSRLHRRKKNLRRHNRWNVGQGIGQPVHCHQHIFGLRHKMKQRPNLRLRHSERERNVVRNKQWSHQCLLVVDNANVSECHRQNCRNLRFKKMMKEYPSCLSLSCAGSHANKN